MMASCSVLASVTSLRGSCRGAAGRRQRGFIVRVIRDFLDVLGVLDGVVLVHHENGPAFNSQFLDQSSVI